jgi:tetratricopeptide (TPR) repeat protein
MTDLVQNEFSEETILEMALRYQSLGLEKEAIGVLKHMESYTKIKLWLAYLLRNKDTDKSNRYLQDALKDTPDFVFPYRTETIPVLQWGLNQIKNWKLEYYLAQNYMAVGKNSVGVEIIENLGDEPDSGTFYRFRALILKNQNYDDKLKDFNRALKLSEGDWKVWIEITQFYLTNEKFEEAYKIASKSFKKFPGNNDIGLNYANTLLMVEKYDKSIAVLSKIEVLPSEMGGQSRKIYYDAHVLWGNELMLKHNYKKAVEVLEESKMWPQNLGVGKPYSIDSRLEDYLLAICYGELKQENKKVELLNSIIEKSNGSIQVSSVNHLFGLLSLKDLNKEEDASKLLLELENAAQKKDLRNRTTLAIAFYKNDKDKLAELKDQKIISDGFWNIIVTLLNE